MSRACQNLETQSQTANLQLSNQMLGKKGNEKIHEKQQLQCREQQ